MKKIGIYLHIPFCKSKCYYCDFISYCNEEYNINSYIECMQKEIEIKASELYKFAKNNNENFEIDTIYIGGGTPSFIKEEYIIKLVSDVKKYFSVDKECEITIEVNPDTASLEKLVEYKKVGINRISIGLQTTKNELLKEIGRIHNYEKFKDSYNNIKSAGFTNINVDLMIGMPNQNIKDVEKSIQEVIKLAPSHISVYSLIIEEGTKLFEKNNNGELHLPDENLEREMYWKVKEKLEKEGFIHYEISNFAKKGKSSKHNCNCWNQNEYLGIGVAAHSFFNSIRFSNTINVEEYIKNIQENSIQKNQTIHEILSLEEKQKEFMILGLRKLEGIQIRKFKEKFGQNPIYIFRNQINKLQNQDLIQIDGDFIRLTNKGLDLANIVWEEFI